MTHNLDPEKYREHMREYMRDYRRVAYAQICVVCGKDLGGRRILYCGRKCRQHAYHLRHGDQNRARYRAWHVANRERSVERVRLWRQQNPERFYAYINKWRRQPCPYCGEKLIWPAKSCRECSRRYGCICRDNPACGVVETHKHCPCGTPILTKRGHYHVEPCELCALDMKRLGLTFPQLFELGRQHDATFEEAA